MAPVKIVEFADIINKDDFIDTIIRFADRKKFQIDICMRSEKFNIAQPSFPENCRIKIIPGLKKVRIISTAWKLARLLKKWDTELLHAHHFDQIIIGWLATRLNRKTKLIIGRHYSDSLYRMPSGIKKWFYFWLEKKANKAACRIIVPSIFIKRILTEKQKIDKEKVDIIYYAFNPAKYEVITPEEIEKILNEFNLREKFVIGTFARLHEEKGHYYLIEAIKILKNQIPNLKVLLVGDGPERKKIKQQIFNCGLQDIIELTGWRKDALKIMKTVNLIVQPTLQEAFSQVMCEAMYLKKGMVITDVSGVIDLIEDHASGIIIPTKDSKAIYNAIHEFYSSPSLQVEMGENAFRRIVSFLPYNRIITQYSESFLKCHTG